MRAALTLLAGSLLLSGCSLLVKSAQPAVALQSAAQLVHWRATGKLGLHYQGKGGSLYFTWEQDADRFHLDLSGPLGQGHTVLSGETGKVSIDNGEIGHREADSAEALMQDTLGWQAPVSRLASWLRGLPATPASAQTHDTQGNLATTREADWSAVLSGYEQQGPYALPRKILIDGPDTSIKVIVSEWDIQP